MMKIMKCVKVGFILLSLPLFSFVAHAQSSDVAMEALLSGTAKEEHFAHSIQGSQEEPDFLAKELWEVCLDVLKVTQTYDDAAIKAWNVFYNSPTKANYTKLKTEADLAIVTYNRHDLAIINLIISPLENKLHKPLREYIKARVIVLSAMLSCAYYAVNDGSDENKLNGMEKDIRAKQEVAEQKTNVVNHEIPLYQLRNGL